MKALIMIAALGLSGVAAAHDGEGGGDKQHQMIMVPPEGGDHSKHFFGILEREVQLTGAQKAKVKAIMSEVQPKLEERWKKIRELNRDVKEIMHDESEKIRAVLTPEQKEKFDEMKEHMEHHRGPKMGDDDHRHHKPGPQPESDPEGNDNPRPEHPVNAPHVKHAMPDDGMGPPEMMQGAPEKSDQ